MPITKPGCCPNCGASEVEHFGPHTKYECGSTDYAQRPGTFKLAEHCRRRLTIYLAGPLFTKYEQDWNAQLACELEKLGYKTFLPQRDCNNGTHNRQIFNDCVLGVDNCDVVLANVDGTDADSGTAFEIGYAYAKEKVVILYRTDFRKRADDGDVNLMLSKSCGCFIRCLELSKLVVHVNDYLQIGCATYAQEGTGVL